ncbi:MAG: hypothetical protein NWE89_05435 [Candidatus Bathyarchaeota archaeon]|nr:hypothetical protein [Candidatus Bathyarchaeota archaeon]
MDDLVIRALSHSERKNILRIVGSYEEGVNYTGILGESGLSTGRLNYHLGELEGFLKRDEDRRYSLSELGRKAVAVLSFIKSDIDEGILETVNTKRARRLKGIRRRLNIGFYLGALIINSVTILMIYLAWLEGDTVLWMFTPIWGALGIGVTLLMNRSRHNDPDRILWVVEWLEWRLFGNYRARE